MKKEKSDIDLVKELSSSVNPNKLFIGKRLHLLITSAKRTGYGHELDKIQENPKHHYGGRHYQL